MNARLYLVIFIVHVAAREFPEKDEETGVRKYCYETCKKCDIEIGRCTECWSGFYGALCDMICPMNCENSCEKTSGVCHLCKAGYHGSMCDKQCSSGCKNYSCERNTGACTECKVSIFHGEYCNISCPTNCMNLSCSIHSGQCKSCKPGFFGKYCQHRCSNNCVGEFCNITSGVCSACKNGYFGSYCNMSCQENCTDETLNLEPRISTDFSEKHDSTEYKVTVAILSVLLAISVALNVAMWTRRRCVLHKATTETPDTYDNLQPDRGGPDAAYSDLVVTSEQQENNEDYVNTAV